MFTGTIVIFLHLNFLDRQIWANSVDPNQTAPISVYTVYYSVYIF